MAHLHGRAVPDGVVTGMRCSLAGEGWGDKCRFLPGHACTTVNLHDAYVVVRHGVVEAIWPIVARGRSR